MIQEDQPNEKKELTLVQKYDNHKKNRIRELRERYRKAYMTRKRDDSDTDKKSL